MMEVLPTLEHPNTIIFTKAFSRFAGAPEDDDILVLFVVLLTDEGYRKVDCGFMNEMNQRDRAQSFFQTSTNNS